MCQGRGGCPSGGDDAPESVSERENVLLIERLSLPWQPRRRYSIREEMHQIPEKKTRGDIG